jgi:hypothetical protein
MKRGFKISELLSPEKVVRKRQRTEGTSERTEPAAENNEETPEKQQRRVRLVEQWKDRVLQSRSGAGKKRQMQTSQNAELPTEQFDGQHWKCMSASVLSPGQFTGWFEICI